MSVNNGHYSVARAEDRTCSITLKTHMENLARRGCPRTRLYCIVATTDAGFNLTVAGMLQVDIFTVILLTDLTAEARRASHRNIFRKAKPGGPSQPTSSQAASCDEAVGTTLNDDAEWSCSACDC